MRRQEKDEEIEELKERIKELEDELNNCTCNSPTP